MNSGLLIDELAERGTTIPCSPSLRERVNMQPLHASQQLFLRQRVSLTVIDQTHPGHPAPATSVNVPHENGVVDSQIIIKYLFKYL